MNSNDLVDRQEVAINSLEFERQVRELRRVTHLRRILQTYACYYNKIRTLGHWIKMRRSPVWSSRLEASNRIRSLVDLITITSGFRFRYAQANALQMSAFGGKAGIAVGPQNVRGLTADVCCI